MGQSKLNSSHGEILPSYKDLEWSLTSELTQPKHVWLQHTSKLSSIFPFQRGLSSHCHWKFPKIESNLNLPHIAHAAWTQIEKSNSHKLCEDTPVALPASIFLCLKQRWSQRPLLKTVVGLIRANTTQPEAQPPPRRASEPSTDISDSHCCGCYW